MAWTGGEGIAQLHWSKFSQSGSLPFMNGLWYHLNESEETLIMLNESEETLIDMCRSMSIRLMLNESEETLIEICRLMSIDRATKLNDHLIQAKVSHLPGLTLLPGLVDEQLPVLQTSEDILGFSIEEVVTLPLEEAVSIAAKEP
jgi:hypothetical protein